MVYAHKCGFIFAGLSENMVFVFDASTGELIRMLKGHSKRISALACSPDGATVLTASADGGVYLWNAASLKLENRDKRF